MTIEYIQKIQNQGGVGRANMGGLELNLSQREWANDLTTWVISNKILYTGPGALDQFCQALLLHLQSMGSGNALASATSMLLNQVLQKNKQMCVFQQIRLFSLSKNCFLTWISFSQLYHPVFFPNKFPSLLAT